MAGRFRIGNSVRWRIRSRADYAGADRRLILCDHQSAEYHEVQRLFCWEWTVIYWQEKHLKRLEDIINERKFANKKVRTLVKKVKFMEKMPVLGAVCNAVSKTFEGEMLD